MGGHIIISVIIGLIVAGIVGLVYKGELTSVAMKHEASNYIRKDSLNMRVSDDTFICTNLKKTPKPKQQEQQKQ